MREKSKKLSNLQFSCSVIIPARDEAGTIELLLKRLPKLGRFTEVIFVEGHSNDQTWSKILEAKKNPQFNQKFSILAFKQKGKGKKDAITLGFLKAKGEILLILDADLSVKPEDLRAFFSLLASGKAQFANGSRFIYPKEKGAMKYFNHLGNKFFALVFSLILKQRITDTLCGTKALFKKDYSQIISLTQNFSQNDPYGDFQLLLGAGMLRLKVKEVPVKYNARIYGQSKISPFWDGIKLIRLLFKAAGEFLLSQIPKK